MADDRRTRGRPENKTPRHKKKAKNRTSSRRKKAAPKRKRLGTTRPLDPSAASDAETRYLQPYQATKTYLCPGCNRDIPPGTGHIVAVPPDEPDLRRHWHRGCWNNRTNL